ncbi:MAG: ORF6N domain-containing protein [Candidatus Omnitrophica bacterium]|nr:ORF6N domain-containing protein [Candidatus Omnitrophota bacterium]
MKDLIPQEVIERKIYLIRGHKVMLSMDLAKLYGVPPMRLNEQVKRNIKRFPDDFLFQLNGEEYKILKSQIAISSWGGARRANPYAFTERGVAMLSSVLNSERAIEVNIAIIRAFVRLREILLTHKDLASKIAALELKYKNHDMRLSEYDKHIMAIFEAIKMLMAPPPGKSRRMIGFKQE